MDGNDPVTVGIVSSAVTALLVWLSGKGWPVVEKAWDRFNAGNKELRQEAKEGPERELAVVREQLAECKLTLKGVIVELEAMREHNKNCEVAQARQEAKLELLVEKNKELQAEVSQQDRKIIEQDQLIASQQEEIAELKHQLATATSAWKRVEVQVQDVQKIQDSQPK